MFYSTYWSTLVDKTFFWEAIWSPWTESWFLNMQNCIFRISVPKRQPLAENLAKARLLNLATWHLCLFGVFLRFSVSFTSYSCIWTWRVQGHCIVRVSQWRLSCMCVGTTVKARLLLLITWIQCSSKATGSSLTGTLLDISGYFWRHSRSSRV